MEGFLLLSGLITFIGFFTASFAKVPHRTTEIR